MKRRHFRVNKTESSISLRTFFARLINPKNLTFIIPIALGALTVLTSIQGSASNSSLLKIEREIARLETENSDYNAQLISQTSLTRVQETSLTLNLVRPTHIVYLNKSDFLAKLP